ncbi:MAG: PAS domain S-box protein [Gammaproteobacteria bacterium]|nr:PAS domain S-box protein [Gammaproteobacteria bacterium]
MLRGIPLPALALAFGVLTGLALWLVVDRLQTRALSHIFDQALESQLDQQARESLIRFDEYRRSFAHLARLVATHRRMADYLDPIIWGRRSSDTLQYDRDHTPPWLPDDLTWQGGISPAYFSLVDPAGQIRELYSSRGAALPVGLIGEVNGQLVAANRRSFVTLFNDRPWLIVTEPTEDNARTPMGSIVILSPIDDAFLSASQQFVKSSNNVVAILDPDAQRILASSSPVSVVAGSRLAALRRDYMVTAQSFFDYDGSDMNLLFATLLPRASFERTGQQVLDLERRQRLIGAAVIVSAFVLLFVFMSSRISRLLRRVSQLSRRALDVPNSGPLQHGNQLLILEEWIRDFVQLVMRAREEMRRQHETELLETEKLRVAIMDASLDAIVTVDERGGILDFNPTAQETFDYRHEEAIGRSFSELVVAPKSRDAFERLLYLSLAGADQGGALQRAELQAVARDGRVFPVELSIKPVFLEEQLVFTLYLRDIAERKVREAEIRSLAAFPSESPIPVLRINGRGVITYANQPSAALLKHWGCRPLQTLPVNWRNRVEAVLQTGSTKEFEVQTDDGIYSLLLAPVAELGYVNVYARDITSERLAEEEAKRRQNELVHVTRVSNMGEMATGIAHELNQPLSAIVNYANGCARRLRLDIGGKDELLEALGQISDQAGRAGEIIKRLRGMVSRRQPVRELVDLNVLARETCSMISHELKRHELAIERRLSEDELWVRVDSVQIEQVLINLLRNALDAMIEVPAAERRLVIESGVQPDGMVYVCVQDNGSGISSRNMEHLFDAFFSTKESGMGMGLAISQTIINNHHGKIRADSWPGKGSVFTIELPPNIDSAVSAAS